MNEWMKKINGFSKLKLHFVNDGYSDKKVTFGFMLEGKC